MATLPTGTVTLLFTDIEGSTQALAELGREAYALALADHRRLVRGAVAGRGGVEVEMLGDSFHFAFADARGAVEAAAAAQRALAGHRWEAGRPLLARMGLHTGEPAVVDGLYTGLDVHRAARVMSAAHGGQVLLSPTTCALVEEALPPGLGVRDLGLHRLKDFPRPQRLFALDVEGLPAEFPPPATLELRPTNLPAPPNRLIGREEELAAVRARVLAGVRLLTLTGPGGTGKTRLALAAAAELVDDFDDGVFFVPLAPVRDPALALDAVAQAIGLRERPGRTVEETLGEHLAERRTLLVLDNLEHLPVAAPALARLLAAAPGLALLATSREPLRLAAEQVFPVPPLAVPAESAAGSAVELLGHAAPSLFLERARAVRPGLELDEEGARAVVSVCARLDGLPLALELAAARVSALSPRALLARLDRRLPLLTVGAREADVRQRTLRDAIAWSYELLPDAERTLFARLSVFVGGCRCEAAEEVCDVGDLGIDVLEGLAGLVAKSLLRRVDDPDGEPRFRMLETIREYASERLRDADEEGAVRRRHARWIADLAERSHAELRGPHQASWLDLLEREHGNVRAALAQPDGTEALRLAAHLWRFWNARGHFGEGRRALAAALAGAGADWQLRWEALRGVTVLAVNQGDGGEAAGAAETALGLARGAGDERRVAEAVSLLADVAAVRGEASRAIELWEEAIELSRNVGDRHELAINLYQLATSLRLESEPERAAHALEESLALFRELDDTLGVAAALWSMTQLVADRGALEEACALVLQSLALFESARYPSGLLDCLEVCARLAVAAKEHERAARLWGAYEAAGEEIEFGGVHPLERGEHERAVACARAALGEREFDRARARGRELDLAGAVAFAREALGSPTRA